MTRELRLCLAIVQEMFCGDGTFEGSKNILCCDTVSFQKMINHLEKKKRSRHTGFVKNNRKKLI